MQIELQIQAKLKELFEKMKGTCNERVLKMSYCILRLYMFTSVWWVLSQTAWSFYHTQ